MPKIVTSDRDPEQSSADQDPLNAQFHDFDSMPYLKGVFHGTNAEGHHFICNGVPVLVSAEAKSMKTVNKGLEVVAKGRLVSIQYLGKIQDEDASGAYERNAFEVVDIEATA